MQKIYYYITLFFLFLVSCSRDNLPDTHPESNIMIRLQLQDHITTRVVDEDNLVSEQTIKNLSIFFTEPSQNAIVYKYVYTGFTISGDYQLITLPLEPADLLTKDIYVIANYNNETTLEAVSSFTDIQGLFTPEVNKTNNLNPLDGFCMYGMLANFDFTANPDVPPTIPLIRTCAKFRINLVFPDDADLSTNNSFLITHAAEYTYVVKNLTAVLPSSDYFNFATPLPLTRNSSDVYTNITYVYEANQAPAITVYTHLNNSVAEQEFTTTLPIPQRNYLYDLSIEIYEEETGTRSTLLKGLPNYILKSYGKIYNEKGDIIEEF